jgi:Mn2+/Fe2+ NRAMP family transporter
MDPPGSAVINGIMVAPIIVVMMKLATNRRVMTRFTLSRRLRVIGWFTAVVMAFCVSGLIATWV